MLADLQRRKGGVPASLAMPRPSFDVFHHEDAHGKELAEKGGQVQFPLPAGPGGGRQPLFVVFAVLARLAAGGLAIAACTAHAGAVLLRFFHSRPGLRLHIGVGVVGGGHHNPFAFGTGIDTHRDGLLRAC